MRTRQKNVFLKSFVVFVLLFVPALLLAQSGYRPNSNASGGVMVSVVARRDDNKTNPITSKEVSVYDNGVEQSIRNFTPDPSPARIALLVDNSLTIRADVDKLEQAAREFAYEIFEGDKLITTNSVEGFYSIFKRGMRGTYQHCQERHLHRYLNEFDFRYSNRVKLGVDDVARADRALKLAGALLARGAERGRRLGVSFLRGLHGGFEPADLAAAGREGGEIVGEFLRQRRQPVDRRLVFAAHRPQREQALLDALLRLRIVGGGGKRQRDVAARLL